MPLIMNLEKIEAAKKSLVLSLEKAGFVAPPPVELVFVLDVSGSFEDEHRNGLTNDLLMRLVPWGLAFDPDRKLEVLTFSDGAGSVHRVGSVNATNCEDFVRREIVARVPGWKGGTDYSHAIEAALRQLGWLAPRRPGLLGRLFGAQAPQAVAHKRSLVIFVTDGDNVDKQRTMEVLRASEARGDVVYFLFLGVSNQGGAFPFLERIGTVLRNTGFVPIRDLREFVQRSDAQLNDALLTDELMGWLRT